MSNHLPNPDEITPDNNRVVVSVIIPCYNGSAFVAEAIRSVLTQSAALEIIVVDDGSSDDSAAVVAALTDARVRLIRHEYNRGIAAARNTGVRHACGHYVAFLDQDDLWRENKLARQLPVLDNDEQENFAVVFSLVDVLDDESGRITQWVTELPDDIESLSGDALVATLFPANYVTLGAAVIRKRMIDDVGGFDESVKGGSDDFELLTRLARAGRFACVREALLVRRIHGGNYTDPERMGPEKLAIMDRVAQGRPSLAPARTLARSKLFYFMGRSAQWRGERRQAARLFGKALRERPLNFKALAALVQCGLAWPWRPTMRKNG